MRALSIFLAATALMITAGTAQAGPAAGEAPRATAEQMDKANGIYKLSDGRRAQIFTLDSRLYIRIGRSPQQELVLDGQDRFASRDGRIVIRFGPGIDNQRIVLEHDSGILRQDTIRLAANERPGRGAAD